jgi:hypothetical protein
MITRRPPAAPPTARPSQRRAADLLSGQLDPDGWVEAGEGRRWRQPNISSMSRGRGKLGPAFPGRSGIARGSPFPACPWSAQAVTGWKPKVFFQVGAACSLSECAITMVASRSTTTRPRPVTRIVSCSRTAPAWDTSPRPSADTVTRLPRALFFTLKVPSARLRIRPSTSPILPVQRHFSHLYSQSRLTPGESPRLGPLPSGEASCAH